MNYIRHCIFSSTVKLSCFQQTRALWVWRPWPSHLTPRQADCFTVVTRLPCSLLFWCSIACVDCSPTHSLYASHRWREWGKAQGTYRSKPIVLPYRTYIQQRGEKIQQHERNAECVKGCGNYGDLGEEESSKIRRQKKKKKVENVSSIHIPRMENTSGRLHSSGWSAPRMNSEWIIWKTMSQYNVL